MKARAERIIEGSVSRPSSTERSSQECTIDEVVKLTMSSKSAGGRLRLSSVKYENMPPPTRAWGNALRVSRYSSASEGAGGHFPPGDVDFRSAAGDTSTVLIGQPAASTFFAKAWTSAAKPSTDMITASSQISASKALAAASCCSSDQVD